MHGGLAAAIARRPGTALVANVAVLAVGGVLAAETPQWIAIPGGEGGGDLSRLFVVARSEPSVGTSVNRAALQVIRSGIRADPAVATVKPAPGRETRRRSVLKVKLRPGSPPAIQEAAEQVEQRIDPGPLTVTVEGNAIEAKLARERFRDEALRLGLLVLPFVLLVLILALGPRHALAALLAGLSGALGGLAALRLLAGPLELAGAAALGVAVAVGLAVGVELAAALRGRLEAVGARRWAPAGVDPHTSNLTKLTFVAAAGAALASAAGLVFEVPVARGIAVGGAAAALTGAASAAVATPAVHALLPPRPALPLRAAGLQRHRLTGRWRERLRELLRARSIAWPVTGASIAALAFASAPLLDAFGEGGGERLVALAAILTMVSVAAAAIVARLPGLALARGIAGALPGAAGAGLVFAVAEGRLPLDLALGFGEADLSALMAALVAVGAVAAARGAIADAHAAVVGTLVVGAALGVLVGSDVAGARQLGGAVAVGLLADLIVVRAALVPAIKRGLPGGGPGPREKAHGRSRNRRFRLPDRLRR